MVSNFRINCIFILVSNKYFSQIFIAIFVELKIND